MSFLRIANLRRLREGEYDVLVIGGGINGAVSAACLAARGARVALVDRGDFASFTSQQSSNLAWGGIKYMESYEFGLVRKLCLSRNHLLATYPSAVQEIRFFTMHPRGFRKSLFLMLVGAWLYWFIGNLFTRTPRLLTRRIITREEPIVDLSAVDGGFEYSDAYLRDNDARFVWNFVRSALNYGCVAVNYVEVLGAERDQDGAWTVRARDVMGGDAFAVRARVLVNACGPFVDDLNARMGTTTATRHVFSKGIHLIVDKLTTQPRVLTFFADDGRPFFVIPMGRRTCIGTTDTPVTDPVTRVTDEDRAFVLDNINKRLRLQRPLTVQDIIAERCGVRPLAVESGRRGSAANAPDWAQLSRRHVVEIDAARRHVSIFGGKLTDCLNVGEEVAAAVCALGVELPYADARWYGEPPEDLEREFLHRAALMRLDELTSPRASEKLSSRLWRRYGGDALSLLEEVRADPRSAEVLIEGAEYLRCEIAYAARHEMIVKLEDFLRRRSKIALVLSQEEIRAAPGLREACRILFGDEADVRYDEYFAR